MIDLWHIIWGAIAIILLLLSIIAFVTGNGEITLAFLGIALSILIVFFPPKEIGNIGRVIRNSRQNGESKKGQKKSINKGVNGSAASFYADATSQESDSTPPTSETQETPNQSNSIPIIQEIVDEPSDENEEELLKQLESPFVSDDIGIIAVSIGGHTVGLRKNGTVVAVGDNNHGQCNVFYWNDIIAVAAEWWHTIGLKRNGTVVITGLVGEDIRKILGWRDIVAIAIDWITGSIIGLQSTGRVVTTRQELDWSDIAAIFAGGGYVIGVQRDGTLVATAGATNWDKISTWKNV